MRTNVSFYPLEDTRYRVSVPASLPAGNLCHGSVYGKRQIHTETV